MENVPNEIIHLTVVITLMCMGAGINLTDHYYADFNPNN